MAVLQNLTDHLALYLVARDPRGLWAVTTMVKATFAWQRDGRLVPVPSERPAGGAADPVQGGPPRSHVDVILAGELKGSHPAEQWVAGLTLGSRLRKEVRVFGERRWVPTASDNLVPCRPQVATSTPITWTRSFGGTDPEDPTFTDRRNPIGTGIARKASSLQGRPAPRFEAVDQPVRSWRDRPAPVGFGPLDAHWDPRVALAGTYDEQWRQNRWPLLPLDFDPVFFNVAPVDQQVDGYRAGETVTLNQMTGAEHEAFPLPPLDLPITVVTTQDRVEDLARVDTIIIDPGTRKVSVIARASSPVRPTAAALRRIVVGEASSVA